MNFKCIKDLRVHLIAKFAEDIDDLNLKIEPEICPPEMEGDITVNCFRFARFLQSNPMEVASAASEFLNSHDDVEKASDFLLDKGAEIVAFHLGEKGSFVKTKKETVKAPPCEVKAVNPTGVGDEYNAAFIYGMVNKWPLEKTAKFANAAAAIYLSRPRGEHGNPSYDEVLRFYKK